MNNKKSLIVIVAILNISLATIAQVPSYVPTNDLVGWWPFNGNANDESMNGNNGTVSGASLVSDRFGNNNSAYSFNGIDSRINISNRFFDIGWNQFTISLWMYSVNSNNSNNYNDSKVLINTDEHNGFAISSYGNNNPFSNTWDNKYVVLAGTNPNSGNWNVFSSNIPVSSQDVVLSNWNHIVVVKNSNVYSLYINGSLDNTYTATTLPSSYLCKMVFGNLATGTPQESFFGILDDYGIWKRALSDEEIIRLDTTNNVGFNEVSFQNKINIYPNPAKSIITIEMLQLSNESKLSIYNINGEELINHQIKNNKTQINIEDLKSGVYFVKIIMDKSVNIRKIIKD